MQLSRRCRGNVATAALLCFYFLHTCLAQPGGEALSDSLQPSCTKDAIERLITYQPAFAEMGVGICFMMMMIMIDGS